MVEESSTERFLRLLNEQNARIAADMAAEEKAKLGVDPIREQRDAERREKFGTLRAREKSRSKTRRVRNVFGSIDLSS